MSRANRGWTCPGCGLVLPRQVRSCRCGTRAPGNPASSSSIEVPKWAFGLGAGILLVSVAALWLTRSDSDPAPLEESSSEALVAPEPSNDPQDSAASAEGAAAPLARAERSLEEMLAEVLPSVVSVHSSVGSGSGFFVESDAIITNLHVVGDDRTVDIRLADGETLMGRVDRVSSEFDLALVDVRAGASRSFLTLANMSDVRVGQEVMAIGSPLGVFENSVTRGIVSAVRTAENATLVQTDASINPGNSGGPLINRSGAVIGIATLRLAEGESIGFAVASDHARALMEGGGHLAGSYQSSRPSGRMAPKSLDDLNEEQHEIALQNVILQYQGEFDMLSQSVMACPDLGERLAKTARSDWTLELGRIVVEYVDQQQVFARSNREIPTWNALSCLRSHEPAMARLYQAIVIYDEIYKSYATRYAARSRRPTVERKLPAL